MSTRKTSRGIRGIRLAKQIEKSLRHRFDKIEVGFDEQHALPIYVFLRQGTKMWGWRDDNFVRALDSIYAFLKEHPKMKEASR
jgi:hypothetical protein